MNIKLTKRFCKDCNNYNEYDRKRYDFEHVIYVNNFNNQRLLFSFPNNILYFILRNNSIVDDFAN